MELPRRARVRMQLQRRRRPRVVRKLRRRVTVASLVAVPMGVLRMIYWKDFNVILSQTLGSERVQGNRLPVRAQLKDVMTLGPCGAPRREEQGHHRILLGRGQNCPPQAQAHSQGIACKMCASLGPASRGQKAGPVPHRSEETECKLEIPIWTQSATDA